VHITVLASISGNDLTHTVVTVHYRQLHFLAPLLWNTRVHI